MAGTFPQAPLATDRQSLCPVVLSVPGHLHHLRGRPQVAILSRLARVSVRMSARLAGMAPPAFEKNQQGAPQPSAGIHWSLSHKPAFVAGIAATVPIGIDIEQVRSPSKGLYQRIASAQEWQLGQAMAVPSLFYRIWTAKEAVLKAEGIGLRALSRCKVTAIPDRQHMRLEIDQRNWTVTHYYIDRHVVALTCGHEPVYWQVDPAWPPKP